MDIISAGEVLAGCICASHDCQSWCVVRLLHHFKWKFIDLEILVNKKSKKFQKVEKK
jgi:hypothetical protein